MACGWVPAALDHLTNRANQLQDWNQHRINDIQQLRDWNQHRSNEINAHEIRINNLESQNTNQASIITTLTNNLNEKAIEIAYLQEQNIQLTQDFKVLKDILCSHIDCNTQVIGEVESSTDGLNLI